MADYLTWSPEVLADNLNADGHAGVAPIFLENEITGDMLSLITEDHLKDMGITSIGQRLLILQYISELVDVPPPPPPVAAAAPKVRPHVEFEDSDGGMSPSFRNKPQSVHTKSHPPPLPPQEEPEVVPKYKRDHEKMVEQMRAARKYAAYEKAVQEGRATGPPPALAPIEEPEGLMPCPVCGRKFGENAYRSHVPVCGRMNAGKKPPTGRAGRR